jgi:hypothetical protein
MMKEARRPEQPDSAEQTPRSTPREAHDVPAIRFRFARASPLGRARRLLGTTSVRVKARERRFRQARFALVQAGAREALPLSPSPVAQRRRPAVADIIGARRACTVAMISSVSMPWR